MRIISIYILVFCLFSGTLSAQKHYFVRASGVASYSGASWAFGCKDLQKIVNKALAGDTVFVSAGEYKGGFTMKEGVTVLGGYTANTASPYERIYPGVATVAQQSILNGTGTQRVLNQPANYLLPTTWEGFVIQNGKTLPEEFGIGSIVYAQDESKDMVGIVYRYDKTTGDGMMLSMDEIQTQWGGYQKEIPAIDCIADPAMLQEDNDGAANTASIIEELGETNLDFTSPAYPVNGNYAAKWCDDLNVGSYSNWYLPAASDYHEIYQIKARLANKLSLQQAYWTSNQVGDLLAWAYYVDVDYKHKILKYKPVSTRAIHPFHSTGEPDDMNYAGAGVFLCKNGILQNCILRNNESATFGGGVFAAKGASVVGCLLYGNQALKEGSGIFAGANNADTTIILNNTITNNTGTTGAGLTTNSSSVKVVNTIVWGNTPANLTGTAQVNASWTEDPLFVDVPRANYLLQDASPCLLAGDIVPVLQRKASFNKDLKGFTRTVLQQGKWLVDIGAFQQGESDNPNSLAKMSDTTINVFPNPVKRGETIRIATTDDKAELRLWSLSGSLLSSSGFAGTITLAAPQVAGLYLLGVSISGKTTVTKLQVY
ncbi:hypothetical protein EZS27_000725 [termite gut metagenome]|uniref:Secretion system C-terminal sorting domain-containing protein n=1 Tax=termite gut metagenome TaxID=433724 RepID=A0A5J4T1I0_9ZZZZ